MNTVNWLKTGYDFGTGFILALIMSSIFLVLGYLFCRTFFNFIRFVYRKYMDRRERKKLHSRVQSRWK